VNDVRRLLSDTDKVVHVVQRENTPPRHLVWRLIANVARQHLASGVHHVYRGILGFSGEALQQVHEHALNELERSGYRSASAIANDRAVTRERIAEVG
jgi:PII-like signaling protein